ncbi:HK97 family phage prohead protease [Oceanicella sp. SM1341]|uniref:HK97 family phage prohead protease n=1 Tax=Oceanicella sp. SM1341 TaxID=1548889 RepID=UPI000E4F2C9E|nr:HK97 family phage prohead protease [Oceanicella sp. SM1341]
MSQERRSLPAELRANGRRLEGYAAVFNSEARIADAWTETIAPGAFAGSLTSGRDVLALVDHDPTRILGRTRSGSLALSEDSRGLAFRIDLPDTQSGRDVLALAERGDLGGMSFGFTARDEHRDGDRRELRAVDLFEISVVAAWPAYPDTLVQARGRHCAGPGLSYAARTIRIMEAMKWGS